LGYGARVERVVFYGSQARGDFRPYADYDAAVFFRDFRSTCPEKATLTSKHGRGDQTYCTTRDLKAPPLRFHKFLQV
jgi:hypothetical protein